MILKFFFAILVLATISDGSWAKTAKWELPSEWTLGADLQIEEVYFPQKYGTGTNNNLSKIEFNPSLLWKKAESWRFLLHPTLLANPDNKSANERYFFDPTEAYLRFQKNAARIQLGFSLFSWGVTDGYNPVDVINGRQYFDPLKSRKLGVLNLSITESLPWFDYDLIYIPQARASVLSGEESRWLPREIFIPQVASNDLILLLPQSLRYSYGSRENLNQAMNHNFALRLQKTISAFDIGLSGYEGVALTPLIEPQVTGTIVSISPKTVVQVNPDVILNTKNYRIREGGFSLVAHPWNFLLKYETSYTQSLGDDINLPGWLHENVLGLEKNFEFSQISFIGILQYSFINSQRSNDSNVSLTEIFRNAWMMGGRLAWKEIWTASLMALYDQTRHSHLEEISISRRVFDIWTCSLTADFISGNSDTPLGLYDKNDSLRVTISRSF